MAVSSTTHCRPQFRMESQSTVYTSAWTIQQLLTSGREKQTRTRNALLAIERSCCGNSGNQGCGQRGRAQRCCHANMRAPAAQCRVREGCQQGVLGLPEGGGVSGEKGGHVGRGRPRGGEEVLLQRHRTLRSRANRDSERHLQA